MNNRNYLNHLLHTTLHYTTLGDEGRNGARAGDGEC